MRDAPRIISLATANPAFRYSQREVYEFAANHVTTYRNPRIENIFMSSDIEHRYLALDLAVFQPEETPDQMHRRFLDNAVPLARRAAGECLERAGVSTVDVDCIIAVTCTGYLCPGISSILIREMGLRRDVQRADLVGMGCAGALPGLQRGFDFVKAYPDRKALVVAVEVCSACYYVDDSLETVVGNAICADGAAAALIGESADGIGPEIIRFETLLRPELIESVGFDFREGRLRIILSKDLRSIAGSFAGELVGRLLQEVHCSREDVRHWIIHSGGRKVIDSIKAALCLEEIDLIHSRSVLKEYGNMSSPTVLYVLKDVIERASPARGDTGVMLAMGPGLAVEGAFVRW